MLLSGRRNNLFITMKLLHGQSLGIRLAVRHYNIGCVLSLAVEDIDTATARGVHGCTGQTHGPRVRGTQKTLPPEETAHPAGYGHQEEATVSQLIIIHSRGCTCTNSHHHPMHHIHSTITESDAYYCFVLIIRQIRRTLITLCGEFYMSCTR